MASHWACDGECESPNPDRDGNMKRGRDSWFGESAPFKQDMAPEDQKTQHPTSQSPTVPGLGGRGRPGKLPGEKTHGRVQEPDWNQIGRQFAHAGEVKGFDI